MRETITICGLLMIARQQQQHFGFPHSKYLNILDKSSAAGLRKKEINGKNPDGSFY
jgi:hypothetical protein